MGLLFPTGARAQCQHGASIFKTCESVKRTCVNDADCDDGIECTNDVCDQTIGHTTNCLISLQHADTCGDTTKITEGFDIDDFGGDNVRTPPVSGNLPIDMVIGNAVCCPGPVLPCFVAPAGAVGVIASGSCGNLNLPGAAAAGLVQFRSNTYVIQPDDPDPLPDQGNVRVQDQCNVHPAGCNTFVNTVQFSAQTDLVTGCTNTPKPNSTPCIDTDGSACTNAGCDGFGNCDQAHLVTTCPPDTNPCTDDLVCNPLTGMCDHPPVPDSTPCPDVDANLCTAAGCEQGACVQGHVPTVCPPDTNPCTQDPPCNPQTGLCEHPNVPDSSPCPDSDTNACTTPGCEQGACVQAHITTTCPPDTNPCTQDPACNPQDGQCTHPPVPDSTPCPDTDLQECTQAGCEAGQCVQSHISNACPNHYGCYEIKPFSFQVIPNVTLVDRFGSTTGVTVGRPNKLCPPADKNDEDPTAPDDPDHLTAYALHSPTLKVLNQTVVNQFGTVRVDVLRPALLMVPSAKSLVAPAPPTPLNPLVDHFQCYKVRRSRDAPKFQRVKDVKIDDQFGTGQLIDVLAPRYLCAPVNKNDEEPGAELHTNHLLCYKVRGRAPFTTKTVWIGNQLGPINDGRLTRRQEFCVPSLMNP